MSAQLNGLLSEVASLGRQPAFGGAVSIALEVFEAVQKVKIFRGQCADLSRQCNQLLLALKENAPRADGLSILSHLDEVEIVLLRARRKTSEWARWSRVKSLANQKDIKDGLDSLYKDIETCKTKFSITSSVEILNSQRKLAAIRERDQAETVDLLRNLTKNVDDLKVLVTMRSPGVEEVMGGIQEQLHSDDMEEKLHNDLQKSLLELHRQTKLLPPMVDLTGQVTMASTNPIARGTLSEVYLGEWLGVQRVALKSVPAMSDNTQKMFLKEVKRWRKLQNPHILRLFGIAFLDNRMYLVTPWMINHNCTRYLSKNHKANRVRLLNQIAFGIEYLHNQEIIHGDVRAENVLVSEDGSASISNFGLSAVMREISAESGIDLKFPGIVRWQAPELISPDAYGLEEPFASPSTDIWSFGMLCIEILTGKVPYSECSSEASVMRTINSRRYPHPPDLQAPDDLRGDLWAIMLQCWKWEPQLRPSMSTIRNALSRLLNGSIDDFPSSDATERGVIHSTGNGLSDSRTSSSSGTRDSHRSFLHRENSIGEGIISTQRLSQERTTNVIESTSSKPVEVTGLVEKWIQGFSGKPQDADFMKTFLVTYRTFISPKELFSMLLENFWMFESVYSNDLRIKFEGCYSILIALKGWLAEDRALHQEAGLLNDVQQFAASLTSSDTSLSSVAKEICRVTLDLVMCNDQERLSSLSITHNGGPKAAHHRRNVTPTPGGLATALTIVEHTAYRSIGSSDCVLFLISPQGMNAVSRACAINNKLVSWVKKSVLQASRLERRVENLKFLINTAEKCYQLRNFASMVAIVAALQSAVVINLKRTQSRLDKQLQDKLKKLSAVANPSHNHQAYREALRKSLGSPCVPYLPVHFKDLNSHLQHHRIRVTEGEDVLVNVDNCKMLLFRIDQVLAYQRSTYNFDRESASDDIEYVEDNLAHIPLHQSTEDELTRRSEYLRREEERAFEERESELEAAGFRTAH